MERRPKGPDLAAFEGKLEHWLHVSGGPTCVTKLAAEIKCTREGAESGLLLFSLTEFCGCGAMSGGGVADDVDIERVRLLHHVAQVIRHILCIWA